MAVQKGFLQPQHNKAVTSIMLQGCNTAEPDMQLWKCHITICCLLCSLITDVAQAHHQVHAHIDSN
jgi:hypothetical protein